MSEQTLKQLVQENIPRAQTLVNENGDDPNFELQPTWLLYGSGGARVYVTPFHYPEAKDVTASFIKAEIKKHNAHSMVFICEAWIASFDKNETIVPAGKSDKRKEVVTIVAENDAGDQCDAEFEILRDFKTGVRSASEVVNFHEGNERKGRFVGMFD